MSDQEFTQGDDQKDEQLPDMEVSDEQQDDVTGGAMRGREKKSVMGDSAAAK